MRGVWRPHLMGQATPKRVIKKSSQYPGGDQHILRPKGYFVKKPLTFQRIQCSGLLTASDSDHL